MALQDTETMLCCGDLCSLFIIKLLGQGYSNPNHPVLGNNDGELAAIITACYPNIHIHVEYFTGQFELKSFANHHYPEKARLLAKSGGFNLLCYGPNHILATNEKVGNTRMLNPGAIMGCNAAGLRISNPHLVLDGSLLKSVVYIL